MADIQKRFPGFPAVSANQLGVATVEISNDYVRNVLDRHYARVFTYPAADEAVVSFISTGPFPELKELKHIELELLDGKLIKIGVYYSNDLKWKSADEFAQKTGEAFKLNGSWRKMSEDHEYMICGEGVEFNVNAGFQEPPLEAVLRDVELEDPGAKTRIAIDRTRTKLPYVEVQDFWADHRKLYERQKEREEKAKREEEGRKQTFKP